EIFRKYFVAELFIGVKHLCRLRQRFHKLLQNLSSFGDGCAARGDIGRRVGNFKIGAVKQVLKALRDSATIRWRGDRGCIEVAIDQSDSDFRFAADLQDRDVARGIEACSTKRLHG